MSKVRSALLGIGVASIAATGSWYGAELKTRREIRLQQEKLATAKLEEQIASLENGLAKMVGMRDEIEKKLADSKARRSEASSNDK